MISLLDMTFIVLVDTGRVRLHAVRTSRFLDDLWTVCVVSSDAQVRSKALLRN